MKPSLIAAALLGLAACQSTRQGSPPISELDPAVLQEMMMEFAQPAEEAQLLDAMAGDFRVTTSFSMPDGTAVEETGTSVGTWILGNRFLESKYQGTMMGMPFEGRGWMGWDRAREAYVSMWIDNMGTWMMDLAEGQVAEDGKTISFLRSTVAPGGSMRMREVYTLDGDEGYSFDVYQVDFEGDEAHQMRLVAKRVR